MTDTFGDFDSDDALDHEPADPEQTARKLHEIEGGRWDDLTDEQKAGRIALFVVLLAWLRRQGAAA
jgi:hypothetical protein